jgi:hypothetical protein
VRGSRVEWIIGSAAALAAARALRWAPRARAVVVGRRRVLGAVATLADLERTRHVVPPAPPGGSRSRRVHVGRDRTREGVRYRHAQLSAQRDALLAAYTITSEDRFVAAFAPFAILGPALGITSTIPDVDVTKPRTLTSGALAAACASVDATIVFAAPAALANVVRTGTARMTDSTASVSCCRPAHRSRSRRCAPSPPSAPPPTSTRHTG